MRAGSGLIQPTLPGLQGMLSERSRQAVGALGERWAALELERAGYRVSFTHRDGRGDLLVTNPETGEIKRVEIKTARAGQDGRWQFNMVKKGHCDYRHADVVILLPVLKSGRPVPYIVPIEAISSNRLCITSHPENYAGRLACFRRRELRLEWA